MPKSQRRPTHAGSWYESNGKELASSLDKWLLEVTNGPTASSNNMLKACIVPHAGFMYSGHVAAHCYRLLLDHQSELKRVFILGPSHHVYLDGCALPTAEEYLTPIGTLDIDRSLIADLQRSAVPFSRMSLSVDEEEHSIEMHLPWLAHVIQRRLERFADEKISIVPVLVGDVDDDSASAYASVLLPHFKDTENAFVISSDFCHWGRRFQYTYLPPPENRPIHERIEKLDREGMSSIEGCDPFKFTEYLKRTGNTICGRNPISILLHLINQHTPKIFTARFLQYDQSSRITKPMDSSVSYAAGIVSYVSASQ